MYACVVFHCVCAAGRSLNSDVDTSLTVNQQAPHLKEIHLAISSLCLIVIFINHERQNLFLDQKLMISC